MQIKDFDLTEFLVGASVGTTSILVTEILAPYLALASPLAWLVESVALIMPPVAMSWHKLVAAFTSKGLTVAADNASLPKNSNGGS